MQLRPQIANHDLSVENSRQVKHNLDVSLFERLCISGVPSTSADHFDFPLSKLTVQRRMRPEIADLVRLPLYSALQDHNDVQNYPPVAGMHQALFWLDHEQHEDRENLIDSKDTSHSNMYEVHMVTQLVSHLSKQGCYKSGEIAVITPYVGQLRKLRDSLRNTFSVQMSETDADELSQLDPVDSAQEIVGRIERKELTQTVRIATVWADENIANLQRWIIFRAKKPKSLLCLWYVRTKMEMLGF
jgi:AAA domain